MSASWKFLVQISLFVLVFKIGKTIKNDHLNAAGFKGGLLDWNKNTVTDTCAANGGARLLNLVSLVCSTAQALNTTARDGCYGCFIRYTSLPQGQQQIIGLSSCAVMYFANSRYAGCANRLAIVASSVQVLNPPNGQCTSGYCEFVRCLRRANSNNVIAQCAREVRALNPTLNIALDDDNIRYYTNMTSCILAKTRCNTYNPITGDLQLPGVTTVNGGKATSQVALYNTLQTAPDGTLRVVAFPATLGIAATWCSTDTTLANANWLNNEC